MSKSFYSLDDIIEMNEKRIDEFRSSLNRVLDKYAVPLIVYSAIAIYLVQIIQHEINGDFKRGWYDACFGLSIHTKAVFLFPGSCFCLIIGTAIPCLSGIPFFKKGRENLPGSNCQKILNFKIANLSNGNEKRHRG